MRSVHTKKPKKKRFEKLKAHHNSSHSALFDPLYDHRSYDFDEEDKYEAEDEEYEDYEENNADFEIDIELSGEIW